MVCSSSISNCYPFLDLPVQNRYVVVIDPPSYGFTKFVACPAHFGLFPGEELIQGKGEQQQKEAGTKDSNTFENQAKQQQQQQSTFSSSSSANPSERRWKPLVGPVRVVYPMDACQPIMEEAYAYPSVDLQWNQNSTESLNPSLFNSSEIMRQSKGSISGAIGIVRRGGCVFVEKAYHLAQVSYKCIFEYVMLFKANCNNAFLSQYFRNSKFKPYSSDSNLRSIGFDSSQ